MVESKENKASVDKIPKVSVIIPNYNAAALLARCLDSLAAQSEKDFETIVVDNGSEDESVHIAQKHPLKPRLIRLQENQGFSAAVNAGIDQAQAELLAILNNDAAADPKWLEELVRGAEQNKEFDFFAALVLKADEQNKIESAGVGYTVQARPVPLFENAIIPGQIKSVEVFLASAAALLFRRSLIQKSGKFDPSYFAYLEDIDFFLRARLAAARGMLAPAAIVYHLGAGTDLGDKPAGKKMDSSQRVYLIARNRWYLVWDNLPIGLIFLLAPLIFLGWMRGLIYHLFLSGQISVFLAGSLKGFFSLPLRFKKRKAVKKLRTVKARELLAWMRKGFEELK